MLFWKRHKNDDPNVEYVEDEYYDDWDDDEEEEELDEHYEEGYVFNPPDWAEEYDRKHQEAYESGLYECPECGGYMVFEDEYRDSLVCEHCGYSTSLDEYGVPDGCSYNDLFDTLPAPWDDDEDDDDERYDWDD